MTANEPWLCETSQNGWLEREFPEVFGQDFVEDPYDEYCAMSPWGDNE